MTPEERIDAALDSVLKASGSALKNYQHKYASEKRLADMREAMKKVISDSYISGSNDCFNAMSTARKIKLGEL